MIEPYDQYWAMILDVPTQLTTGVEESCKSPYIGEDAKAWYRSAEA